MPMKRFRLAVWIILLIFLACTLSGRLEAQYTTYTIDGPPGPDNYASLDDLFTTITLVDRDVIVLYQNDSSL